MTRRLNKISPSRWTRIAAVELMKKKGAEGSYHINDLEPELIEKLGISYRAKAFWYLRTQKVAERVGPDTYRLVDPRQNAWAV